MAVFSNYVHARQQMELGGFGHFHGEREWLEFNKTGNWSCVGTDSEEECLGVDPLVRRIAELEDEITSITAFRWHVDNKLHRWDERGMCDFCGWDGNV